MLALEKYLTVSAPRYTSYPTAPHFHEGVTSAIWAAWLGDLDPEKPVSLYLHVPFCRQACWYCGCNMKLASRYQPVADYAQTLRDEILLLSEILPARMAISHLHWGGGTPTSLSPDDLAKVMDTVRFAFDFTPDAELAIESDPRTLSADMTHQIGALGFTRASFGVQEFDPTVQAAINRIQPPEMVAAAVHGLREAGVGGVNFDLIYGLPYQTVASLNRTIELCRKMAPDRIALFGYAHVPWMAKRQRMIPAEALPGASARRRQSRSARATLISSGFLPVGLDHFARPQDALEIASRTGELRRNFQGYTTDKAETLLGVGASAISRSPHGFAQNAVETGAWARAVKNGRLPVSRGVSLDQDDRLRSAVIESLMCDGAVDLGVIGSRFGVGRAWFEDERPALDQLCEDGVITLAGERLEMAPQAADLVRIVAAVFDAYAPSRSDRHSAAV